MDRTTLNARIDEKIAALRDRIDNYKVAAERLDSQVKKLELLRERDLDLLLELFDEPGPIESQNGQAFPKSSQFMALRRFFLQSNNAWATSPEIATGAKLSPHTVRQMTYKRYTDYLESRQENGKRQFRLKAEFTQVHD